MENKQTFVDKRGSNLSYDNVMDIIYRATGSKPDMAAIFRKPGSIYENGRIWFQRID